MNPGILEPSARIGLPWASVGRTQATIDAFSGPRHFAGFGDSGDLSLADAIPPTLTWDEVSAIVTSLQGRFTDAAQAIRASITLGDRAAGNAMTLVQVAGSLEETGPVIVQWASRGYDVASGKSAPFTDENSGGAPGSGQARAENAWRSAGAALESQLASAPGYAHDARLDTVLRQTVVQTAADAKRLMDEAPGALFEALPWWVKVGGALLVAGIVWSKFGGRRASSSG